MDDEAEERSRRAFELLAALLCAGAVARIAAVLGDSYAIELSRARADGGTVRLGRVLELGFGGADLLAATLLSLSFVLVLLAPGGTIGRLGTRVLQALLTISILATVLAAGAVEQLLRRGNGFDPTDAAAGERAAVRAAVALPYVVAAFLAGFLAWAVYRTLRSGEEAADSFPPRDADDGTTARSG